MATSQIIPSAVTDGTGPGFTYRIEGQLVPTLHLALDGQHPVMHEHHVLLWKQTQVDIRMMKLKGAFKRVLSGMPIFMTQAVGAGEIAFSRDSAGQIVPLHLSQGDEMIVREHAFLAAVNLDYTYERVRGIGSMLFGSQGFFIDRFSAGNGEGVLWLHAHGNAQIFDLAAGEQVDVEPGAWLYRERSVGYEQKVMGLKTGLLAGGANLVFNRFTGPGKVAIQSGYFSGEAVAVAKGASAGGVGGLLAGGALGGLLGGALGGD